MNLCESKFLKLPPETQAGIAAIVQKILQLPPSDGRTKGGIVTVGSIPITTDPTNPRSIRIDLVPNLGSQGKQLPNVIQLNDYIARSSDSLRVTNLISHEITHALDPKLQSSAYKQQVIPKVNKILAAQRLAGPEGDGLDDDGYENLPHEFDAFGGGIANSIRRQYTSLNAQEKPVFLQELETWLRNGGDPPRSIPIGNTGNIYTWQSKPTLWRKFQQRMYNLIQELKPTTPPLSR